MAYLGKTPSQAVRSRYYYTATGGETSLSGADDNSNVLTFTDGNYVDVSLNGVALVAGTDYNTTTTNTIGGLTALVASDVVEVIVYDTFSVFGGNMAADLNFKDNVKAKFGASDDLQIYHDGSNSYIHDNGTGDLKILADNFRVANAADTEDIIRTVSDGAVTLYHDNVAKLATTVAGIDVTGVITTDGLTTSADINFGDNDKAVFGAGSDLQIYHDGSNSIIAEASTGSLKIQGSDLYLTDDDGTNMLYAANNGGVTLYNGGGAKLSTTATGVDVTGLVKTSNAYQVWLGANVLGTDGGLTSIGANPIVIGTDGTERFRLTPAGDICFNNSVANTVSGYSNQQGGGFVASDKHFEFATNVDRSAVEIGKNHGNDGDIVTLRKQNTVVGSIGTVSSKLTIGSGATGVRFNYAGIDTISPWNVSTNALTDGTTSLGYSNTRFNNLYLSGGVYLGGTGAANYLDDYEEGNCNLALSGATFSGTSTYTKIGRLVSIEFIVEMSTITGANALTFTNLPFAASGGVWGGGLWTNAWSTEPSNIRFWTSTNYITLYESDGSGGVTQLLQSDIGTGGNIYGWITYRTT